MASTEKDLVGILEAGEAELAHRHDGEHGGQDHGAVGQHRQVQ
jgi:hypothetical protein